ncbi:MAG: hypothetical protein ABI743_04760 [bacterium]
MPALPLPDDLYATLQRLAAVRRVPLETLAAEVLQDWAVRAEALASAAPAPEPNEYAEFDNVDFILALLKECEQPPKP